MPDESSKSVSSFGRTSHDDPVLRFAERVDALRIVPRVSLLAYTLYCGHVGHWFMNLPDPSPAQAAFVSTIWGAAAAWFGFYASTGRKW